MKKRIINQKIADKFVRCYDNGGSTCDRYTAVYIGRYRQRDGHGQLSWFQHCCMSECPFHPQGVGMHGENPTQIDVAPGSRGSFLWAARTTSAFESHSETPGGLPPVGRAGFERDLELKYDCDLQTEPIEAFGSIRRVA